MSVRRGYLAEIGDMSGRRTPHKATKNACLHHHERKAIRIHQNYTLSLNTFTTPLLEPIKTSHARGRTSHLRARRGTACLLRTPIQDMQGTTLAVNHGCLPNPPRTAPAGHLHEAHRRARPFIKATLHFTCLGWRDRYSTAILLRRWMDDGQPMGQRDWTARDSTWRADPRSKSKASLGGVPSGDSILDSKTLGLEHEIPAGVEHVPPSVARIGLGETGACTCPASTIDRRPSSPTTPSLPPYRQILTAPSLLPDRSILMGSSATFTSRMASSWLDRGAAKPLSCHVKNESGGVLGMSSKISLGDQRRWYSTEIVKPDLTDQASTS